MATIFDVRSSAAETRLVKLLEERTRPGADRDAIDGRIWDLFGETWAVMFTDLAGFSRQSRDFGIIHFLQTIIESHKIFSPLIEAHDGILLKTEGDSLLVLYRNPLKALQCAVAMQTATVNHNRSRVAEEQVLLCLGIGYGRILKIGEHDVFGAEVNASAKLGEDTAKAGEILVTGAFRDAVKEATPHRFAPLSEKPPGAEPAFRVEYA